MQQTKNLNNLTKQMSVYNIQFVNNIFLNSLHIVFSDFYRAACNADAV